MQRMKATDWLEELTIKQRLARYGYTVERVNGGPRPHGVCIKKDGIRVHESMYADVDMGLELAQEAERNDPSL